MNNLITEGLPPSLISIEEIIDTEEEVILPSTQETLELRQRESIFYSPFRQDAWYSLLIDFLQNEGLQYSPHQIPFYSTVIRYRPQIKMSGESSMFSESPETFLYGGPSVPAGYQSLSGTY